MDSDRLTAEQAEKLKQQVGRTVRYYNNLVARIELRRFGATDPLYRAALNARNAAQSLWMAAHYASCKSGVGRPAKE